VRSRLAKVQLVLGAVVIAVVAGWAPAAQASTPAVAYQMNLGHTGVTPDVVAANPTKRWSRTFTGTVSYPLIVGNRVFVTVANATSNGTSLYALDASTGAVDWGPVNLYGTYSWSGLAFDHDQIYTVNDDGVMEAFSTITGARAWATQLPMQWLFTSPPTAANGYVYTGGAGSGGTVYAVNESTGAVVWMQSVENGDHSSPALSSSGVYVSYACGQTFDMNPLTGALIWHRNTACEGGGGTTPVLAAGRLYVRDSSYPGVLNATNGTLLAPFASSGPIPAVDSTQIYDLQGSTLSATSISTGLTAWSFSGDGELDSAPLKAGDSIFVGSYSGELYRLSHVTGQVTWSTNVGAPIAGPDEWNVRELTGMAESGGLLVVSATDTVVAYK
jgi:outer membrane protein assembly factor BamB